MSLLALLPAAIGASTSLIGGAINAATAPARKRKFIAQQKQAALYELLRNRAAELGAPTAGADAVATNHQIQQQANQQFRFDPTTFLPFVQNTAALTGGIYDQVQGDKADALQAQRDARADALLKQQEQEQAARNSYGGYYGGGR